MQATNYPECGDVCFSAFELLPDVYHIRSNYGELVFLTLLVGSERALLVDTGYGYGDLPAFVRSITDKPLTVVNSHGHSDHNGGNFQFPEAWQFHCDIEPSLWTRCEEITSNILDFCPPPEAGGFDFDAFMNYDPATTRPLSDGQVFDLGNMTVQTILVGNHSPGSCVFYCPERKLLVAADAVGPAVSLGNEESSSVEYHLQQLLKLQQLPFEHILAGHSDRLIPRSEMECYIHVAQNIDQALYGRYKSALSPSRVQRMYYLTHENGDTGIIILPKPAGAKR